MREKPALRPLLYERRAFESNPKKEDIMRWRLYWLILITGAVLLCCSQGEKEKGLELDAGPPPRPLFYDFEGLKWGMTPEEVVKAWGSPSEEPRLEMGYGKIRYNNRASFKEVSVYFSPAPPSLSGQADVKSIEGPDKLLLCLIGVLLDPGTDDFKAKSSVRAELVSRFGEPLADPKLYESQSCSPKNTEIFRAAECTLAIARWAPAEPGLNWPERLASLQYVLAPFSILRQIPKVKWNDLRGAVPLSPSSEVKAAYEDFAQSGGSGVIEDIIKRLGLPNIYLEEAPGKGKLYYLWLTGSYFKFEIGEGKVQLHERTYVHEPE